MTPARPTAAGELGGAFGDLGTLLPILLGAVTVDDVLDRQLGVAWRRRGPAVRPRTA